MRVPGASDIGAGDCNGVWHRYMRNCCSFCDARCIAPSHTAETEAFQGDWGQTLHTVTIAATTTGVVLTVRVIPRARQSRIDGTRGEALLVRLKAPPVDGAANAELIRTIADALDVPARHVSIVSGEQARQKRVAVSGIDRASAEARLSRHT